MKHRSWAMLGALCVLFNQGCGSEDSSSSDSAEDDIRASTHGKAILACEQAEQETLRRDASDDSRFAAAKKLKTCMAAANDRTLRQIDVRRGSSAPVTHVQFAAYRSDFTAACDEYFFVHPQSIVPRNAATCGAEAEYNLARLLQNDGNLGGAVEPTLQFAPWRSACLASGSVSQMRACAESEVRSLVARDSFAIQTTYGAALEGGNRVLCEALVKMRGQTMDANAADRCRIDAAFLLRSITPS
ncbi:MAG: hypothetical protein U0174_18935 [Polyangiaceae bacterium]